MLFCFYLYVCVCVPLGVCGFAFFRGSRISCNDLSHYLYRYNGLTRKQKFVLTLFSAFLLWQLYVKRKKVATEEERQILEKIDHNYMSDEEDGQQDNDGYWVVRSITWRSTQLERLLCSLQERVDHKETSTGSKHPKNKRVQSAASSCPPPADTPTWAIQIHPGQPLSQERRAGSSTPEERANQNLSQGRHESPSFSSPERGVLDPSPDQVVRRSRSRERSRSPVRRSPRFHRDRHRPRQLFQSRSRSSTTRWKASFLFERKNWFIVSIIVMSQNVANNNLHSLDETFPQFVFVISLKIYFRTRIFPLSKYKLIF